MRAANSRCVNFARLRPSAISSPNVFMSLCGVPCLLRKILLRLHADVISDASADAYRQPGAAHVVRSPCEQHFEAPALSTGPRAAPDFRVAADAQLAGLRDKRVSAPGLPVARGRARSTAAVVYQFELPAKRFRPSSRIVSSSAITLSICSLKSSTVQHSGVICGLCLAVH